VFEHKESEEDFTINRFKLEEETEKQPALMRHYTKKLAIWSAKVKDLKRKLEYTQGVCAEIIRNSPKEYGLTKDSDKVVYSMALGEEDYVIVHDEYIKAVQQEGYYESAVQSMKQKGSMLKELVGLWLNDYFANPIVRKEGNNPKHRLKIVDK
jgi:hypothetical protein